MQNKLRSSLVVGFLAIVSCSSTWNAHAVVNPITSGSIPDSNPKKAYILEEDSLENLQFILEHTQKDIVGIIEEIAKAKAQTEDDQKNLIKSQQKVQIATAKIAAIQKELDQYIANTAAIQTIVTADTQKIQGQEQHLNELLKYVDKLNVLIKNKTTQR